MIGTKVPLLQKIFFGIGLFISLLTFGSLLGQLHWTLDVLSHFHIQYTALLLIAVIALLILRDWHWRGLIPLAALLVNLYLLAPFYFTNQPASAVAASGETQSLRVMSMNISTSNAGYAQVIELLREREPDVVYLSEVRDDLVAMLESELSDLYPIRYAEPSRQTLGVAILARDSTVEVQTVSADENAGRMRRRYLRADFEWEGTPITLAGIHPLPPMRGEWAYGRDREIGVMGALAQEVDHPFILVGDLNASPWSLAMRSLLRDTDLQYATKGYGIWPTWLLGEGIMGRLLGAPLDHILVSPEWTVLDYTESGDIGSDHVPLQADLVLRSSE